MRTAALFHVAPRSVDVRPVDLPSPKKNQILIESRYSAISPGTESMIYKGYMPKGMSQDESIGSLQGAFDYPFAYGYTLVGEVVGLGPGVDSGWRGRKVFAYHPHQSHALVSVADCFLIPKDLPERAALFLPNMEAALNFVMDANPLIGERAIVFGLGVVGLLTTALLARFPLSMLLAADPIKYRRDNAIDMGASDSIDSSGPTDWDELVHRSFQDPDDGFDLALELSGGMEALNQAIQVSGFNGRIVVGSWYGTNIQPLDLGSYFHRRRTRIISSQVSTVAPDLSGRWTKDRRIELTWEMIKKIKPEKLISHAFPLEQCGRAFEIASDRLENALQVIFEY